VLGLSTFYSRNKKIGNPHVSYIEVRTRLKKARAGTRRENNFKVMQINEAIVLSIVKRRLKTYFTISLSVQQNWPHVPILFVCTGDYFTLFVFHS
jgi:hypothetical protein